MGKASRTKRERRTRRNIEQALRDGVARSFAINFPRAAASGRMRPLPLAHIVENHSQYESMFLTREAWSEFVQDYASDNGVPFRPAVNASVVRFGYLGKVGECDMYTDAFSAKEEQTLEQVVAVERPLTMEEAEAQ